MCMHMADSLHCIAETCTTLWSDYTLINKKFLKTDRPGRRNGQILRYSQKFQTISITDRAEIKKNSLRYTRPVYQVLYNCQNLI